MGGFCEDTPQMASEKWPLNLAVAVRSFFAFPTWLI